MSYKSTEHNGSVPGNIPHILSESGGVVPQARTTISDLPPETLIVIFRPWVHRDPGESTMCCLTPWPSHEDLIPQHPFPECIASVAPFWRQVMSAVPDYWTHLVIWIGRDPTPLPRIREYLAWSRGCSLEIYILRRYDPSLRDLTEKAQVRAIMEVLLPSIEHWNTLCMRLLHHAKQLKSLSLEAMIDDLPVVDGTEVPLRLAAELDAPKLAWLSMCGPLHHRLQSHNAAFPLIYLLRCLDRCASVCNLELNNLHLDCSNTRSPIYHFDPPYYWKEVNINFINVGGDMVAEYGRLLGYPPVEFAMYTRCSTPTPPGAALTGAEDITLTEINSPAAFVGLLAADPGDIRLRHAKFYDCDGLTPGVLRKLVGTPPDPEADPPPEDDGNADLWLCPNLQSLGIRGCTRFKSADLRAMLEARCAAHEATDFAQYGKPGFVLAPEDKEWFDANLLRVDWDGWCGGYAFTNP
ncbi:uncharacterized protein B0H18DRAFT_1013376, partial [Fomitopsis serialis]|uniref:uncharacterized protein n=1 Tax=Fomitopsis serialis TaxID=139415 RepID=UPI0020079B79